MSDAARETLDRYPAALKAGGKAALRGGGDDIEALVRRRSFCPGPETGSALRILKLSSRPWTIIRGSTRSNRFKTGSWRCRDHGAQGRKVHTETLNTYVQPRDSKIVRYQVYSDTAALDLGLGRLAA